MDSVHGQWHYEIFGAIFSSCNWSIFVNLIGIPTGAEELHHHVFQAVHGLRALKQAHGAAGRSRAQQGAADRSKRSHH